VQRFPEQLGRDAPAENRQVMARPRVLAELGRLTDERQAGHVGDGIYELKTRGGGRVLCFVDEGRVIVGTDSLRKPKARQLSWLIGRSRTIRASHLTTQRDGAVLSVEEW